MQPFSMACCANLPVNIHCCFAFDSGFNKFVTRQQYVLIMRQQQNMHHTNLNLGTEQKSQYCKAACYWQVFFDILKKEKRRIVLYPVLTYCYLKPQLLLQSKNKKPLQTKQPSPPKRSTEFDIVSFCLQEDKAELEQQNYMTILIGMFKYTCTYILLQTLTVYKTFKHTPISHVHAQKYQKNR